MKHSIWLASFIGITLSAALGWNLHASNAESPQVRGANSPLSTPSTNEPLVARSRHSFSNGTTAKTTVLVGPAARSADGDQRVRFIGSVTWFGLESMPAGDLASLTTVGFDSAEAVTVRRSLPRSSNEPTPPTGSTVMGTCVIHPRAGLTWGQVSTAADVSVDYSESGG